MIIIDNKIYIDINDIKDEICKLQKLLLFTHLRKFE